MFDKILDFVRDVNTEDFSNLKVLISTIYKKLINIIPNIATRRSAGKSKLHSDALMDLNLDIFSYH